MVLKLPVVPGVDNPERYPSKWDIIPIHTSDRASFKACRRAWSLSSPASRNLIRKVNVHGIAEPLWFGTGIHHALERFYGHGEDPVAVWIEWFELQWNGGIIDATMIPEFADRKIRPHPTIDNAFVVDGLNDLLPSPEDVDSDMYKDLGIGMMTFYKDYSAANDKFDVVSVEHEFSVPIFNPETNSPILVLDTRRMPEDWQHKPGHPLYHIRSTKKGEEGQAFKFVHARGRIDMIVQDRETGQYGILDHKTAARVDDDYFRHLSIDDQITTYVWAAQREAEIFDLPWKKIDFVIYQALRKVYPKPPTPIKNGNPSTDRQAESTTPELFEAYIAEHDLQEKFEASDQMQRYYAYLLEQGDKVFIQRDVVRRNKFQVAQLGERLYHEATDMLNVIGKPELHYPNPRKEYLCLNCTFRVPCENKEKGFDWESVLDDGYTSNYDR